jgi:hypothetical protein
MGGGYMPENNFHVDDLSQEHKDKIAKKFPMGLAASKTHPIGTKDANKMIKVMHDGHYTMDQREYDEENDDYVDDEGHSEYIPGHHIGNELLNNPGLNRKHINDIIAHIDKEHYTGYDVEQDMNEHKGRIINKLLAHPKTPKSFIDDFVKEKYKNVDYHDLSDHITALASHPDVSEKDLLNYSKQMGESPDSHHPKVNKKFIDEALKGDENDVRRGAEYLYDRPELFNADHLHKLLEDPFGLDEKSLRDIGRHPEHNIDHIKKLVSHSLTSAMKTFGDSKHLPAEFLDGLFTHMKEKGEEKDLPEMELKGKKLPGIGLGGMNEYDILHKLSQNPNMTSEIADKALGIKQESFDDYNPPSPFYGNAPISEKMIAAAKKKREIASRMAENPHVTEDILHQIMHKTRVGRRSVLHGIVDNKALPYETKKKFFNDDERDMLTFGEKVPENEIRDTYHKLKARTRENRKISKDDHSLLEHILGFDHDDKFTRTPDDVLKDAVEWGEQFDKPYTEWAKEELERREQKKFEKTASVGHGALGAPTSLVGGATGAYGLKQPVLNPDIEGDGGEERAKTALGNLFGEEDISQMLQGLNKSEVRSEIVSQAAEIIADEIRESLASRMLHERD